MSVPGTGSGLSQPRHLPEDTQAGGSLMGLAHREPDVRPTDQDSQWLRTCLAMQRTPIKTLVQEDPTCYGATKPIGHNY